MSINNQIGRDVRNALNDIETIKTIAEEARINSDQAKKAVENVDDAVNYANTAAERANNITSSVEVKITELNQVDAVQFKNRQDNFDSQLAQKVQKGNVAITDINKNLGKLDQTYMSDEFLQQMAGNTPINAVPTNESITTVKLANKAVELEKISDRAMQTLLNNRIYNLITNGDFINTSGWNGLNASLSASGNTLTSLASGASATCGASFDTANNSVSGNKYFAKITARLTNSNATFLRLRVSDSISGQIINSVDVPTPTNGQWYDLSFILTPSASNLGRLRFQVLHLYPDATTASGKVLEIRYANLINMTQTYGTGNEPVLEKMRLIINSYTNGYISGLVNKNDGDIAVIKEDLKSISIPPPPKNKRRMITITFDDGHISNYTRAYPILSENGFRATEFINGATADVDSTRMTSAQIKELAHAGWEMACHTFTHPNLTTLTDAQIMTEIKNNKTFLEELTGRQVFTHAIPFGQHDARVRHMLNGAYEAVRKTQARFMSYGESENLDQCPGWFWDTLSVSTIKGIIDNLMNDPEPKWLIVGLHGITAEPHADLLSEAEFREIVEYIRFTYAQNNLVDVVPFYEGARRILT